MSRSALGTASTTSSPALRCCTDLFRGYGKLKGPEESPLGCTPEPLRAAPTPSPARGRGPSVPHRPARPRTDTGARAPPPAGVALSRPDRAAGCPNGEGGHGGSRRPPDAARPGRRAHLSPHVEQRVVVLVVRHLFPQGRRHLPDLSPRAGRCDAPRRAVPTAPPCGPEGQSGAPNYCACARGRVPVGPCAQARAGPAPGAVKCGARRRARIPR